MRVVLVIPYYLHTFYLQQELVGSTEFADSRTAYDDLSEDMKNRLDGLVANHSLFHSRKTAVPSFFVDTDPMKLPLSKHLLVQKHEGSGRSVG